VKKFTDKEKLKLSNYTKKRLIGILLIAPFGGVIGGVLALMVSFSVYAFFQGVILGAMLVSLVFLSEVFLLSRLKKVRILYTLVLKTILYTIFILISFFVSDILIYGLDTFFYDVERYLLSTIILGLPAIFGVFFLYNVNKLLGQRALIRLFFGKYNRPILEERIFMFIDLKSSTTIAEEIGDIKFHSFLNDFFISISKPVIECGAEIYKYVGDEVILTWLPKKGVKNFNCIKCFFIIMEEITKSIDYFTEKYGVIPEFRGGVHCGPTVIGEMGDYKKEVAYIGDAVNTSARILQEASNQNKMLLISKAVYDKLNFQQESIFDFTSIGNIPLKGKKTEMELYSVDLKNRVIVF